MCVLGPSFVSGYLSSVNVSNFIDDLGVSASIEISWLRYHVKTRARRGSSFSQLGLEPNHAGWTAQSLFFLEESCRVKRSDTQTFSNYFKRGLNSQALKTFFQLLQIKRLQLKLTNTYKTPTKYSHNIKFLGHGSNNIQKHHKPQKQTKIHLQALPCTNWFHLVPTWFLPGSYRFLWVL